MNSYFHSNAESAITIPQRADEVWAMLTDWAGVMKWLPDDAALKVEKAELIGQPNQLPRTRHLYANGMVFAETLFHQDDAARRIYYDYREVNGGVLPGVRNYLATTTVDALGEKEARMSFYSQFDLPLGADENAMKHILRAVYATVATGIGGYLARSRAGA